MSLKTVFISRALAADSLLKGWADENGVNLIDRSLLRFSAVPFQAPERAEVWFFYSRRAVQYSLDALKSLDCAPALAALGPGTARAINRAGFRADFIGSGRPDDVVREFTARFNSGLVFFPRARNSRRSVQSKLPRSFEVLDAVCYDNYPADHIPSVYAEAYIFTSPMNAGAYLDAHPLPLATRVIAIGTSTSAVLTDRGVAHYTAANPTESGLINCLNGLDPATDPTNSRI